MISSAASRTASLMRDQRKLGAQMIRKRYRGGEEGFEGRLFDVLRSGAFEARVQIIVEVIAQIDFIEGIGRQFPVPRARAARHRQRRIGRSRLRAIEANLRRKTPP